MDVREKLVEIFCSVIGVEPDFSNVEAMEFVEELIAHGVTVQDSQKPIKHKVDVTAIVVGNASWGKGTTLYKCPKCGNFISRLYEYCFKCGQAFDWSELPQPPKGE